MTVIFYDSLEAEGTTNSTSWVERASKQGYLDAQKHWLWVYAEYGGTATNRDVEVRVLVNGVEQGQDRHQPSIASGYKSFFVFGEITPPADDTLYTVSIEYRSDHSSQTALIRRVRLMVMQE